MQIKRLIDILEVITSANNIQLKNLSQEVKYSAKNRPVSFAAKFKDELKTINGKDLTFNDVAIYTAILLFKMRHKPYWSLPEIKHAIMDKDFMEENFEKLVSDDSDMTEEKKKKTARELANWIANRAGEVVTMVNAQLTGNIQTRGPSVFAHQFTKDELNDIFAALKILMKALPHVKMKPNTQTYIMMQEFMKELSKEYVVAVNNGESFSQSVNEAHDLISKISAKHILWMEPNFPIDTPEGLERYRSWNVNKIASLNSIMKTFSARKKVIGKLINERPDNYEMNDVRYLLGSDPEVRDFVHEIKNIDDMSSVSNLINNMAKRIVETKPKIMNNPEIKEHEDPESEIAGILTYLIRDPKRFAKAPMWKKSRSGKRKPKNELR